MGGRNQFIESLERSNNNGTTVIGVSELVGNGGGNISIRSINTNLGPITS
jgi:hypothetical protein